MNTVCTTGFKCLVSIKGKNQILPCNMGMEKYMGSKKYCSFFGRSSMHPSTWKGHLPFLVVATSTWQTSSPRGLRIISKSMSTSPTTPQKSNIDTNICHMFQGSYLIQPIILGVYIYIYIQPLVFRGFSNPQPVLPLWPDDLLLWRDMITEDHGWGADNDGVLGNRGCVAKQRWIA